jgi:hypothetical protein
MHEAKLAAREQRRSEMANPGPGAYEQSFRATYKTSLSGSTAFRSRTPRGRPNSTLRDISLDLNPGQYNPNSFREMAYHAKRSFSKSASSGAMPFAGAVSERKMPIEIMGGDGREGRTPDPGQYAEAKRGMVDAASKMKSAVCVFKSGSQQRVNPLSKDENSRPPVGHYHPDDALTVPSAPNAGQSLASKTQRFHKSMLFDRSYSTSDDIGPGAYRVLSHINGSSSTVAGSVAGQKAKGRNASFRSESVRDLNSAFFANERTGF